METPISQSRAGHRQRPMIAVGPHRDSRFLAGVARFAHEAGYRVNPLVAWAIGYFHPKSPGLAAGIIGVFGGRHEKALAEARKFGLPLVSIGTPPTDTTVPAVCPDYARIGRLETEHLIRCGYRRLIAVGESAKVLAGAQRAAAAVGIVLQFRQTDSFLDRLKTLCPESEPVGVLAVPDTAGVTAIEECLAAGLAVPEDVGVIGAGNVQVLCDLGSVPLTSVDPNHEQVGYEAGRLMHKILTGKRLPRNPVVVPPRGVIVRRSTDFVVTGRAEVKTAATFIREHFDQPITPQDVAEAAGLCRRRLDQVFIQQIGRTVAGEIERRRVQTAAEMLVQTDRAIADIAQRCGFSESRGLWRSFKRHLQCTPRQYRAQHATAYPES